MQVLDELEGRKANRLKKSICASGTCVARSEGEDDFGETDPATGSGHEILPDAAVLGWSASEGATTAVAAPAYECSGADSKTAPINGSFCEGFSMVTAPGRANVGAGAGTADPVDDTPFCASLAFFPDGESLCAHSIEVAVPAAESSTAPLFVSFSGVDSVDATTGAADPVSGSSFGVLFIGADGMGGEAALQVIAGAAAATTESVRATRLPLKKAPIEGWKSHGCACLVWLVRLSLQGFLALESSAFLRGFRIS